MKRVKIYNTFVLWTSPLLFVLMWLQLMTGLGSIKGRLLSTLTLGLLDPATAGKLHTVWLTLVTGLLIYAHAVAGFQMLVYRLKWIKRKTAWEIGVFVVTGLTLLQFLLLYFIR